MHFKKGDSLLAEVVSQLLKEENKRRLVEIIRNLNTKQEYSIIAQALLNEILPRFDASDYLDTAEYKGGQQNELKDALKVMSFYSQKHVERAERGLKRAFYPEYVLSQMTIDEEVKTLERKNTAANSEDEPMTLSFSENKNKSNLASKSAKQIKAQIATKQKKNNDNLFGGNQEHIREVSPISRPEKDIGMAKKRFKKE